MNDDLKKGDIFVNEANGAWVRVTKVEDTKRKGWVVRFQMGTGARCGMAYIAIAKLKASKQMSLPIGDFLLTMLPFDVMRKDGAK